MLQGRVKFFSAKGFGFIAGDDGSEHFFHISNVINREELQEGDRVEYEVALNKTKNKMYAADVRIIERANGRDPAPPRYGQAFFERDNGGQW
jgi:cold shock protein